MKPPNVLAQLTLANQLTFLRLVSAPFLALAILRGRFDVAVWIFAAVAVTDLLDGLVARMFAQRTPLGAYLDPAADKILVTVGFLLQTEFPRMLRDVPMANRIPIWLTTLTISRDVFIVAVSMMLYLAYGTTRFEPSILGKWTTGLELITVGLVLVLNDRSLRHPAVDVAVYVTLVFILASGLHYIARTVEQVRAHGTEGSRP